MRRLLPRKKSAARVVILFGLSAAVVLAAAARVRPAVQPALLDSSRQAGAVLNPTGTGAQHLRLAEAAMSQVGKTVRYSARYVRIRYPGGDVPMDRGACSDVVVRAFRAVGIDLQVEVHRDMQAAWSAYPHLWGLTAPDSNIDHRRVPNLQVFFQRKGKAVPVTSRGADYLPGDIVAWDDGGSPHIGIVSTRPAAAGRFLIVHNHGQGVRLEDKLFALPITGHYRFF
jgi:uncharacterized protein YijF (DUF1287 family)